MSTVPKLPGASHPASDDALPWRLRDIPLDRIDLDRIRPDESMFFLLAAASFVEIASDLYASNLAGTVAPGSDASTWLTSRWQPEEVQHGRALRAYVQCVWPEFDWEAGFASFFAEYEPLCATEHYEATQGLEMVARCAIETGTSVYYRALNALADEPVLVQLTDLIRRDEVRHYKQFYRFFCEYERDERNGRWRIFWALARRMFSIRHADADIALKHVFEIRYPGETARGPRFRELRSRLGRLVRSHYPLPMAAKMLLKPLDLPAGSEWVYLPLARVAQRVLN